MSNLGAIRGGTKGSTVGGTPITSENISSDVQAFHVNLQGVVPLPTGAATALNQAAILTELQGKADLTDTQPVSVQNALDLSASSLAALELIGVKGADGATITSNSNPVPISDAGGSITIDGSVSVSNFPSSTEISNDSGNPIPISGTVNQGTSPWVTNDPGLPDTLGQKTAANSTSVVLASDQPGITATDNNLKNKIGATATLANVSASVSSVTLIASNVNRISAIVYNDSTSIMYLKYGSAASATSFTQKLYPDDSWIVDDYNGIITGIWVTATGAARTTEVTL